MSASKRGTRVGARRVGAVAFAVGVSMAGPAALGVASADSDAAADSAAASGPSDPSPASPARVRPAHPGPAADSPVASPRRGRVESPPPAVADGDLPDATETPSPRASRRASERPAAGVRAGDSDTPAATGRPDRAAGAPAVPAAPGGDAPAPAGADPAPPAAAAVASGGAAGAPSGGPAAPRPAASLAGFPTAPPPALAAPVATLGVAVGEFFDSTANWISGLPRGPVADLLAGALLLVRRSLFQAFPALNVGHTTGQAAADVNFNDAQMRDYLLGLAKQQYGDLFGATVPVYDYGPYGPLYDAVALAGPAGGAGGAPSQSDTNTQVSGVDEADFVENDGQYIYAARGGKLTITRADLSVASESALSGDVVGAYLAGDKLTVITQSGWGWYGPLARIAHPGGWMPWKPQTTVTVYDVADRAAPAVAGQTVFDGAYQDSRAVDGVVYVVTQRSVDLPEPEYTEAPIQHLVARPVGAAGPADAAADVVADAMPIRYDPSDPVASRTYETWDEYAARVGDKIVDLALPHAYRVDPDGNTVDLGLLAAPKDIVRPHADNQWSVLTVATVDSRLGPTAPPLRDSVGVMVSANGGTVYMTPDSLYVATPEDNHTDSGYATETRIDRFAVSGPQVSWTATGLVSGTLINQFAMDASDGFLRVATQTDSAQWGDGTWSSQVDNGIYVLDTAGNTLDQVGALTGLAPGEQLYAVRYVGDTAYLVTFVRVDPLFAVDLSDPAAPALRGELKVPGFSNYLQPVGDGLLLGIGQEREADSWDTHLHATLFDVRDGANMTQVDREFLDPGFQWSWSDAQFDHHALLYSPQDGLLVVPVSGSGYDPQTGEYTFDQYLKVLRVSPDGVDVVGDIHTDEPALRTVRIGDILYAVGHSSVTAYRVSDLSEIGRTAPALSAV